MIDGFVTRAPITPGAIGLRRVNKVTPMGQPKFPGDLASYVASL
jgi:hypothetical protein